MMDKPNITVPLGVLNVYVYPEALWRVIMDYDKSVIFDRTQIYEIIENFAYNEPAERQLLNFLDGPVLKNWVREQIGSRCDDLGNNWWKLLRFQWRKESDRMIGLYAFIENPQEDKPIRTLTIDLYVKPNSIEIGGGHYYHVGIVEKRTLTTL